ncbi:MAG: hypothetical protein LBF51_01100 [Zoogloeaceae bacterium]|nr:hypothetical protein [Zoogloeaceae bacterium]
MFVLALHFFAPKSSIPATLKNQENMQNARSAKVNDKYENRLNLSIGNRKTIEKIHEKTRKKSPCREDEGQELDNLIAHSDMSRAAAVDFFGVSRRTLEAWITGKSRIPAAVMRLARARMGGDLSEIFGKPYDEIRASVDSLHLPGMKYPIPINELRATWLYIKQAADARAELALLKIRHAETKKAAAFYRTTLLRECADGDTMPILSPYIHSNHE